ncbi:MAG TPA: cytochrome c [Anaerolineales bacterium]|nr:cytochrome c [Anaerolineales bacterium]
MNANHPTKLFLLLAAILLTACGVQSPAATAPTATAPPPTQPATQAPTQPASPATAAPVAEAAEVSFTGDVLPIFEASCTRCHGSSRQSDGLAVHTYADLMAGSSEGAVITPNDAAASVLVQVIVNGRMPKGGSPLSEAEIQIISDWINAGAPDN